MTQHTARPWKVRAIQLDLARQPEKLDQITDYVDFAADWGYNYLVLYLEGRVGTRTFTHPDPSFFTYSLDDMRKIVGHAHTRGMQVVPFVNTLAHVEHFMASPELRRLRENGVDLPRCESFCASNPETLAFLESYFKDLAEVFIDGQFFVGGDEVWNLATCPRCRERLSAGETREEVFVTYLLKLRDILARMGKRMWMADDMFETISDAAIEGIPRDVVLTLWCYEPDGINLGGTEAHFRNLRRRDWLSYYERCGFDVLVMPWSKNLDNASVLMDYARQHGVLGGVQTVWEMFDRFLAESRPVVGITGYMMSHPGIACERAIEESLRELFPSSDETLRRAISALLSEFPPTTYGQALPGQLTQNEIHLLNSASVCCSVLESEKARPRPAQEQELLDLLHLRARAIVLAYRTRDLLHKSTDPRYKAVDGQFQEETARWCDREMRELNEIRSDLRRKYRGDIPRGGIQSQSPAAAGPSLLEQVLARPSGARGLLTLELFLYDSYSLPILRVEASCSGEWRTLLDGTIKPLDLRMSHYSIRLPVECDGGDPTALRFTVSGFGGQGICYASVVFEDRVLAPGSVLDCSGPVTSPEAMLEDDSSVCLLGSPDTGEALRTYSGAEESVLEIGLKRLEMGSARWSGCG